jgi:hypothetical protein
MADETPPPMPLAAVCCMSMTNGKVERHASESILAKAVDEQPVEGNHASDCQTSGYSASITAAAERLMPVAPHVWGDYRHAGACRIRLGVVEQVDGKSSLAAFADQPVGCT